MTIEADYAKILQQLADIAAGQKSVHEEVDALRAALFDMKANQEAMKAIQTSSGYEGWRAMLLMGIGIGVYLMLEAQPEVGIALLHVLGVQQ